MHLCRSDGRQRHRDDDNGQEKGFHDTHGAIISSIRAGSSHAAVPMWSPIMPPRPTMLLWSIIPWPIIGVEIDPKRTFGPRRHRPVLVRAPEPFGNSFETLRKVEFGQRKPHQS